MNLSSGLIRERKKNFKAKLVERNSSQSPKSIFFVKIPRVTREDLSSHREKSETEAHTTQKTVSEFRIRIKLNSAKRAENSREKYQESLKQFKMPELNSSRFLSRYKNSFLRGSNKNDTLKKQHRCFSNSNSRIKDSEKLLVPGKYKKIVVTLNNLLS